jgi:hypothetical protein
VCSIRHRSVVADIFLNGIGLLEMESVECAFPLYVVEVQAEIELRWMRYVVAVAEERNFTRAALRCHVTQPALSRQIAVVEATLGAKLFERRTRSVIVHPRSTSHAGAKSPCRLPCAGVCKTTGAPVSDWALATC